MSALNISLLTRQMRYSSPRVIGRAAVDCAGGNGEGLCCSSWGHPAAAIGTFHGSPGHIAAASSCPTPVIYKPLVRGCLNQEARYQQRIRKGAEELASPLQALSFPGELLSFVGPGWGSQAGWDGDRFKTGILPEESLVILHCFMSLQIVWSLILQVFHDP